MRKIGFNKLILFFLSIQVIYLFTGCATWKLKEHQLPDPVDTKSVPIVIQEKTAYQIDDITVDNNFDGARLNGFEKINDTTYRVIISPENFPINASTYFAFRIQKVRKKKINLEIYYTKHQHRYIPKLSYDRVNWISLDSTQFDTLKAG